MVLLKKIFEFLKANIVLILVLIGIMWGVSFIRSIYWTARYDEAKAIFEMEKATLQKSIKAKLAESAKWEKEANTWRDAANVQAEKNRILLGKITDSDARRKVAEAKVAAMTPDEVVIDTRLELGVKDANIWLTAQGIVFDITSAKTNLVRLKGWTYYTSEIIPQYYLLVQGLSDEVKKVKNESEALRFSLSNCQGAVADYATLTKSYDKQLKKAESVIKMYKWTVGGAVVIVVIYVVLKFIGVLK